jgi:hypothetical protein
LCGRRGNEARIGKCFATLEIPPKKASTSHRCCCGAVKRERERDTGAAEVEMVM